MPKKNKRNDERKRKLIEKKKDVKILKKTKTINLFKKDYNTSSKTVILKAKKNQLRCHYCKILMLRTNYARHLKKFHSTNLDEKKEINREIISKDKYSESFSKIKSLIESSEESISKDSYTEERKDALKFNKRDDNFNKTESNDFFNELSNTEENRINLIIKFGNLDFNGTIIYKLPNNIKYGIYTFPKTSFIWEKSITKYDIPQLYFNRPTGFSLFSSISDIKRIKKFYVTNHNQYIIHEFSKIKKKNIEGMHIYINLADYSEWKILLKIPQSYSDKEDTVLIEINFPDEFPFEKPFVEIKYYNIGFKNEFRNNKEYQLFLKLWTPHNTIEELLLQIKETIDITNKTYKLKNIDEEKKKNF
jgi:ubiquitin-protein ligase